MSHPDLVKKYGGNAIMGMNGKLLFYIVPMEEIVLIVQAKRNGSNPFINPNLLAVYWPNFNNITF
jgi:hypothetical protein